MKSHSFPWQNFNMKLHLPCFLTFHILWVEQVVSFCQTFTSTGILHNFLTSQSSSCFGLSRLSRIPPFQVGVGKKTLCFFSSGVYFKPLQSSRETCSCTWKCETPTFKKSIPSTNHSQFPFLEFFSVLRWPSDAVEGSKLRAETQVLLISHLELLLTTRCTPQKWD